MANLGLTVNQLAHACRQQIGKGNGNKHVLISSDDEGNEFHTLFYGFTDNDTEGFSDMLELECDGTHTVNDCVILG